MIDTQGIKDIVEESKDYFDSQLELTKLKTAEQASYGISTLLMVLTVGAVVLLVFICISLFLGFLIADQLDSFYKGFGIVSLIYGLLLFIIILLRNKIITRPLQNKIIQEIFKGHE